MWHAPAESWAAISAVPPVPLPMSRTCARMRRAAHLHQGQPTSKKGSPPQSRAADLKEGGSAAA
eukprot:7390298-Prymnesium_polylepis.1